MENNQLQFTNNTKLRNLLGPLKYISYNIYKEGFKDLPEDQIEENWMHHLSETKKINLSKIIGQTSICPDCGKKITVENNGVTHRCNNHLITYPLEAVISAELGINYSIINQTKIGLEKYFTEMLLDKLNDFQKIYNPTNPKFTIKETIDEVFDEVIRLGLYHGDDDLYLSSTLHIKGNDLEENINNAYNYLNKHIISIIANYVPEIKEKISTIKQLNIK